MPMFMPIPPIGPEKHRESEFKCKTMVKSCNILLSYSSFKETANANDFLKLFISEGNVCKLILRLTPEMFFFFFCEANFTDNIAEESTGLNLEGRGVVKGGVK